MATAPLSPPRLRVLSLSSLRPLIPPRGSFLLADHAYRSLPTSTLQSRLPRLRRQTHTFRVRRYTDFPLPHLPACVLLSCETFRPEPATRQFVWSFAPMPISCHRVAHQNGSGLLPAFPPASASTGIVHCLSGPSPATLPFPSAPGLPPFASPQMRSPWSVFQYGSESSAYSSVFSLFTPDWGFFNFPSRYFFAIGLQLVFSLRCFHHRFALHYQAALLLPFATSGALTRSGSAFHRISQLATQRPQAFHRGSFLFSRPY